MQGRINDRVEEWLPIKGFEGLYEISSFGRIKNLKKSKIMKRYSKRNSYAMIYLHKGGKGYVYIIHRLVAEHFIPNPGNKPIINHKDGIKYNNCVDNLEWCTYSENSIHAYKTGLTKNSPGFWKNKFGLNHFKSKITYQLTLEGKFINEFKGAQEIENILEIKRGNIQATATGNQKTSAGYRWRYKEDVIGLVELPHKVLQGEGNFIGQKMLLLRCVECDVYCYDCDSSYSWNKREGIFYDVVDLKKYIENMLENTDVEFVMVTGGAPSIQQESIKKLIDLMPNFKFQIEDAGNNPWPFLKNYNNVYFSFSPKIGALQCKRTIQEWEAFKDLPRNYITKVVTCKDSFETDVKFIIAFQDLYGIPNENIYLMPMGVTVEDIQSQSQFLIDKCFEYGFNFSTRLHILIYGNKRLV